MEFNLKTGNDLEAIYQTVYFVQQFQNRNETCQMRCSPSLYTRVFAFSYFR